MMKKLALITALVAAAVFLSGAFEPQMETTKKIHTVADGETLWNIAWQYMPQQDGTRDVRELVYKIKEANNMPLQTPHIHAGDVLIIPLETAVKK